MKKPIACVVARTGLRSERPFKKIPPREMKKEREYEEEYRDINQKENAVHFS